VKLILFICLISFLTGCFGQKSKPPEAIRVDAPSSVSTKISKEQAIVISLTSKGKVYLLIGDSAHKDAIINNINTERGLNLNDSEIARFNRMDFIGLPLRKLKTCLDLKEPMPASRMEGIPTSDSNNNELVYWVKAIKDAFKVEDLDQMNLLLKGDHLAKFPTYKAVIQAFKKNDIYKFKIVTNPE
jgi:biopolymer transport protein ExbD